MNEKIGNTGKMIRMGKILSENNPYTIIVDLSFISSTGPFPALKNCKEIIESDQA